MNNCIVTHCNMLTLRAGWVHAVHHGCTFADTISYVLSDSQGQALPTLT